MANRNIAAREQKGARGKQAKGKMGGSARNSKQLTMASKGVKRKPPYGASR
jgi:hypothetical protein